MKRIVYILISIIAVLALLFCTGCNEKSNSVNNDNDDIKMAIYSLKRNTVMSFLDSSEPNLFNDETLKEYVYSGEDIKHKMQEPRLFTINKELIDFINNHQNIEAYFETQNITVDIQDTLVFEAPKMPVTIWVKTNKGDYCITVNAQPFDESNVYRLHTFSEYKSIYGAVDATLTVNGVKVITDAPIKIYNGYADVPLIEVLKGFGAVTQEQDGVTKLTINNTSYLLDEANTTLYRENDNSANLLYQTAGGTTFFEYVNGVLMVDTANLTTVLKSMDIDATIILDK